MPISVKCPCGKAFAADDSVRGKSVRCPGCGKTLRLASAHGASQSADGLIVKCACGKLLRIKGVPAAAGLKCPSCAAPLKLKAIGPGASATGQAPGRSCPVCGQAVEPGSGVCLECGTNVEIVQQVQAIDPVLEESRRRRRVMIVVVAVALLAVVLILLLRH